MLECVIPSSNKCIINNKSGYIHRAIFDGSGEAFIYPLAIDSIYYFRKLFCMFFFVIAP